MSPRGECVIGDGLLFDGIEGRCCVEGTVRWEIEGWESCFALDEPFGLALLCFRP